MARNKPAPEQENENTDTNVADTETTAAPETGEKGNKSVVPSKYAGKYKNGGQGPLSDFVRNVCGEGDKFEFSAFFDMCRKNGLPEEKVAHYEAQVAEKVNGANGRARMTLGNMLRAKARKDQKLVNLSGEEVEVPEAPLKPTGAAANASAKQEETAAAE